MWKRIAETHQKFHKLFEGHLFFRKKKAFQIVSVSGDRWLITRIPYDYLQVDGMPDVSGFHSPKKTLEIIRENGPVDYDTDEEDFGCGDYLLNAGSAHLELTLSPDLEDVGEFEESDRKLAREITKLAPNKIDKDMSEYTRHIVFESDNGGEILYTDGVGALAKECGLEMDSSLSKWDIELILRAYKKEPIKVKASPEQILSKWGNSNFTTLFACPPSLNKPPEVGRAISRGADTEAYKVEGRNLLTQIEKVAELTKKKKAAKGFLAIADNTLYVGGSNKWANGNKDASLPVEYVGENNHEWISLDLLYLKKWLPIVLEGATYCFIRFPEDEETPVHISTVYREGVVTPYYPLPEVRAVRDELVEQEKENA